MIARAFEIKIALLGNVSAGKTTVLNALFCDKFSEVSMKRTTAGINFFRVHANPGGKDDDSDASSVENAQPETRSAESILTEISADNVKLRMGDNIQEKTFDVQLKKELVPMRKDTRLVFADIPGINEANVVNKYRDYVSENWDTFDCVIVVMDARQGVNTEDQVFLLNFVKEQLKKKKVPVIILCNKVDDPEDEEQAELVKEARKEVEKIFKTKCRKEALKKILGIESEASARTHHAREQLSPAFISVSAIHAFIHQSASLMTQEAFNNFDRDLLEKLGREQIGRRRWNRLSEKEKHREAFKVIKEGYQDGMEDSNFDKLLTVLAHFLGGDKKQEEVIGQQISTALRNLSSKRPLASGGLTSVVRAIYEKRKLLRASNSSVPQAIIGLDLVKTFWKTFEAFSKETFQHIKSDVPTGFGPLAALMSDLVHYHKLTCLPDWDDTSERVILRMQELIRSYVSTLIDLQKRDKDANGWDNPQGFSLVKQSELTPHDWAGVWGSFLLLSYNKTFAEYFGQEKIIFERLAQDAHRWSHHFAKTSCPTCNNGLSTANNDTQNKYCNSCRIVYSSPPSQGSGPACPRGCPNFGGNYTPGQPCSRCRMAFQYQSPHEVAPLVPWYNADGRLLPYQPSASAPEMRIIAPKTFSDTSHVAHIIWTFCKFMESLETQKKKAEIREQVEVIELSDDDDSSVDDKVLVSASSLTSKDGEAGHDGKRKLSKSQKKKAAKRRKKKAEKAAAEKED